MNRNTPTTFQVYRSNGSGEHEQRVNNMNRCTNACLANIPFIYDLSNGNERVAVRLHEERYLTKQQANHQKFV
ncbi:hypothetical protein TNCV_3721441 [Trichonephila clavipes]|nr:hypothetical protein TNCV_3721441 [Trichonephila clavipes]